MKKFCERCFVCQQQNDHVREILNKPAALEIPTRRLGNVVTDFSTHLFETKSGFNAIKTEVDR